MEIKMITTWQLLVDGIETFTPALERTHEINVEFINYFIYICLWCLWVAIIWKAVKYILRYLDKWTNSTRWYRTWWDIFDSDWIKFGRKIKQNKGRTYFNR